MLYKSAIANMKAIRITHETFSLALNQNISANI